MKILFIPGLDGTGALFARLIAHLPKDIDAEIISYETIDSVTFSDQAKEIAERFRGMDIVLVGESYSGRVAYELSHLLGKRVKAIVFIASFVSCPSKLARFAAYLPIWLLKPNAITKNLLNILGFNRQATPTQIDSVFASISQANKQKLKIRLQNIARLTKPHRLVFSPVTYIRPSHDLLVNFSAIKHLETLCKNFKITNVAGGHFIGQSNPATCAKIILNEAIMHFE